jgi:DNA mismatch repair ATPase MutS
MILSQKLLMRYRALKQDVPDCLLRMQVGAFMQVIDQDARTVSQVTGLKLEMAGAVEDPVVVGGFPRSGLDAYVGTWVRAGHSAALAVQDGDNERRLAEVIPVRCSVPEERASAQGTPAHGPR